MRWPSESDAWFAGDLRALYFEARPNFLYGIGSWFGPEVDRPQPLLVVDEGEISVEPFATPSIYLGLAAATDWSPLPEWAPVRIGHTKDASAAVRDALSGWLDTAVVLPTSRPEAVTKVGSVLLDATTNERGTVGVPVLRRTPSGGTADAFLTAGHVLSEPPADVLCSSRWWPFRGRHLGHVSIRSDPWVAPPASLGTRG